MQQKVRLTKKTDALFPLFILLLAAALILMPFFNEKEGEIAVVTCERGKHELPLDRDSTWQFESNGHTVVLTIEKGEIFVSESTCSDSICRRMGRISSVGESILCAKAALSVKIEEKKGGFDGVAS